MSARVVVCFLLFAAVAAGQDQTRAVILLGRTQLLEPPEGFAALSKAHADRKRLELRAEVLGRLRKIAEDEQPAILEALGSPPGARRLWIVNAIAVKLTPGQIEQAKALPGVRGVYPAGIMPAEGSAGTVSEVLHPAVRKPFSARGKKIPWNLKRLHVPEVWSKLEITGEGVVVAMLDAGANYRHTDLRNNIWINAVEIANNGKDDDDDGLVDDLYGFDFSRMKAEVLPRGVNHGTFTSSVVAGDGTGGMVTGVAPRARLMLLQAWGGAYVAARAYQYALSHGADVMSMSFSVPGLGQTRGLWRLMSEQATCAGLVLVSGAGNFPREPIPVQIRIPEGIPCVICAGGVTARGKFPRFVSKGPVEWASVKLYGDYPMPKGLVKPDVCAFPGPKIGLIAPGNEGYLPQNNRKRGNSLSAPHVAGACALVLSANRDLTAWRVKEILERTAKDIAPRGKDNETGAGLLDAFRAVRRAVDVLGHSDGHGAAGR